MKSAEQARLYQDLRDYILEIFPDINELLYNTYALSTLYTVTDRMGDGFCMIVMYANHTNFAFNKGTLLSDPDKILEGTGKLMRHVKINHPTDYRNETVLALIKEAHALAIDDIGKPAKKMGVSISKIKI